MIKSLGWLTPLLALGYVGARRRARRFESPGPAGTRASAVLRRKFGRPPYHGNITQLTRDNDDFRRVLFTGGRSQVVVMSIPLGEDIGEEAHENVEQTLVCVSGNGRLLLEGVESGFHPGDLVTVTAGVRHNIRNSGYVPLKLFTIYAPPNHIDQRVQATKADAQADSEDEDFGHKAG